MAFTDIQKVRIEVGDSAVEFPILSDDEYEYLLEKNNNSIRASGIDAARIILMKLSINSSDQVVDIFSIKSAKAAEQYREALKLYLKSPDLNPLMNTAMPYAGGISRSDMVANNSDSDNVTAPVINPIEPASENYFG